MELNGKETQKYQCKGIWGTVDYYQNNIGAHIGWIL